MHTKKIRLTLILILTGLSSQNCVELKFPTQLIPSSKMSSITEKPATYTVPTWATRFTYYIDPTVGSDTNDGLSPSKPLKTLSSHIDIKGATVLLKRGTAIQMNSNIYPLDTFISGYGSSMKKPRIEVPEGLIYGIGVDSGHFKISGIFLSGNSTLKAATVPGIGGTKAQNIIVEDCEIQSYANGITFAGDGSVIQNNYIHDVRKSGINGGSTSSEAASNGLITGNYIDVTDATEDAITLHDGMGYGRNNKIIGNTIVGTNVENSIDLQGQYVDTLIENNTLEGSSTYSIVIDDPVPGATEIVGTIIRKNKISNINNKRAAIYTRIPNVLITENSIYNENSIQGGPAIAVEASARIINNTIYVPKTNIRAVINIYQKTGVSPFEGELSGNKIVNYSDQELIHLDAEDTQAVIDLWSIDGNTYFAPNISGNLFLGMSFTQWKSGGGAPLTHKDLSSTLSTAVPPGL